MSGFQVSAIKRLGAGGPITAWLEYPLLPGLALEVTYASLDATQQLYGLANGGEGRAEIPDDEFRDWHLARVTAWRGVFDGESPAPFDRSVLADIWQADARFRAWLIGGCHELAGFLSQPHAPAPVAVRAGRVRAASRRAR